MVPFFVSAMTLEESEVMLKVVDKWLRHYYNVAGVRRVTSFNRRATDGIRAQITARIDAKQWRFIRGGVLNEASALLGKNVGWYVLFDEYIYLHTEEVEI